ncbi:hypothetical protein HLB23_02605 [Nocardia uniformis]|uniref:Uncharacterized protein n=1 Tax=Nocardia uniformis TaxID=53432 RepID=A0A849BXD3_9NOCA|nr:hypothetical protein [Nocardia uniformis]NNH68775.1 hypothetical protein [Nocardia uniformis]
MPRLRKSALTATTTFAAMAAAVVLAAPGATAQVWRVNVSAGSSIGLGISQYGTGCPYTVTVEGRSGDTAWLYDVGAYGTFDPQTITIGTNGRATSTWTPQTTGWHRIYADSYYGSAQSTDIQVGTGINLGSACVVR